MGKSMTNAQEKNEDDDEDTLHMHDTMTDSQKI